MLDPRFLFKVGAEVAIDAGDSVNDSPQLHINT